MIDKLTNEPLSVVEQRLNEVIDAVNEMQEQLFTPIMYIDAPKDDEWPCASNIKLPKERDMVDREIPR